MNSFINRRRKSDSESPLSKAGIFIKIALIFVVIVLLIISADSLLEYSEMLKEKEELQTQIDEAIDEIEELDFLIRSPMNKDYIIRVAREKLGLVLPEEIVYYTESKK